MQNCCRSAVCSVFQADPTAIFLVYQQTKWAFVCFVGCITLLPRHVIFCTVHEPPQLVLLLPTSLICCCGCRQSDPQADMWQQAFFKLAAAAGVPVNPSQGQSPDTIIEKAQAARQRDPWVQVSQCGRVHSVNQIVGG